ncbi:MAG TPA: ADP-ribosylglycohydrolase family protein [Acidimicrobiia bacterium]|nr:ADP-ribosylglycohydrolase family protein [Acidimicrobiia bacterium]
MTDSDSRFSLVVGEGDGAMLGLAAGDSAGGLWELGYSAITEQATVIAYQLIEHGGLDADSLVRALREMDGSGEEEPVFRMESPELRAWLDGAAAGRPVGAEVASLDGAPRAVPVGAAFRRDPGRLRHEALALGRLFHAETSSILAGMVAAGGVAASCFGQSGRDLAVGVVEAAGPAAETLAGEGHPGPDPSTLVKGLAALPDRVGVLDGEQALAVVSEAGVPDSWNLVKAGLLLAAPVVERSHVPVEQAAKIGGSPLAAMVGGIVGARVGIRAWPWAFANDTWFAEIGRRLVRGPREVRDLPIPYAVEQHLISGERQGRY